MISITVNLETKGLDAIVAGLAQAEGASAPGPIRAMYTRWGRRVQLFNEERFDRFSVGGGDWAPLALTTIRARKGPGKSARGSVGKFNQRFGGSGSESRGSRSSLARDTARGGGLVPAGRTVSILKDTGVLRKALVIGAAGSTFEMIPSGFVYGVAGNAPHPPKRSGGGAAIAATVALASRAGKATSRSVPKKSGGSRSVPSIGKIAGFHQSGGKYLPKREIIVVPNQDVIDLMAGDAITAVLGLAGGTG